MSLLGRLARPLRGAFLLRRVLVELRGIRRALERQADSLELGERDRDPQAHRGQTFRSYSRLKEDLSDRDLKDLTEVSYVDATLLAQAGAKEEELRVLLGREPSAEEILRAISGEIQ